MFTVYVIIGYNHEKKICGGLGKQKWLIVRFQNVPVFFCKTPSCPHITEAPQHAHSEAADTVLPQTEVGRAEGTARSTARTLRGETRGC